MKRHLRQTARKPRRRGIFGSSSRRQPCWQLQAESLESRHLLAANVLADATGTIAAGNSSEVEMHVELPDAPAGSLAHLAIHTTNADGSTLDPAAVSVLDSAGMELAPFSSDDDAPEPDGITVIGLPAGDFTLVVAGDNETTSGAFHVEVSLLGDTFAGDGVGQVSHDEHVRTSAAAVQALGSGNFNTNLFYRSLGIDLDVEQYDSGMDANGDGMVGPEELSLILANSGLGTVVVELQSDADAPVISGVQLQNDTGESSTDGITTDPTIVGQISDASQITAFTAVLDGGDPFDLTTLFDVNATSDFTLDAADLDAIAGGTLSAGVHTLTLAATDELGNAVDPPVSLTFTFLGANEAPTADAIGDRMATEDQPFSLDVSGFFGDANVGDVLTFSTGTLPDWLTFDPSTATFSGTPTNDDVGTVDITVTATDSQGLTASDTFSLTVDNVNDAPVLADIGDRTATEDVGFNLDLNDFVSDVDAGDVVTITAQGLPDWLSLSDGVLSGTPTNDDVGMVTITVTATDQANDEASGSFQLTVNNVNDPPILLMPIGNQNADQNQPFSLSLVDFFDDVDAGDSLTFSAQLSGGGNLPAWLNLDPATGVLSGTPGNNDVGQFQVEVRATDLAGDSETDTFAIDVGNVPDPPISTPIDDQMTLEDEEFSFDVSGNFSDPDPGDSVTLAAQLAGGGELPAWLSFDPDTGVFTGTPGNSDVGTVTIEVTATDTTDLSTTDEFDLEVVNVNDRPVLVNPTDDQELDQGGTLNVDVSDAFEDEDPGDTLTLSATLLNSNPLPAWINFDPNSGIFSGTPTNDDVGTISVLLTATDSAGDSHNDSFDITVNDINDVPVIADQGFSVDPDDPVGTVVGTILASDPDGDNLAFAIVSGNDAGTFALDSASGELTIADTAGLVEDAVFTLQVEVTDDGVPVLSMTAEVTVTVTGNLPPNAGDDPDFVTDDFTALKIDVSELLVNDTDPDNDTLFVDQVNSTSQRGASITFIGDEITYNPTASDELMALHEGEQLVDTFQYIVSDGEGGTDTATVTVTVDGVDVVEFTIRTTDADGNEITEIPTGGSFQLRVFVQDIRDEPEQGEKRGMFSAYLDVAYPENLITPIGNIIHSSTYGAGASGTIDTPGLLDEVGGVDGVVALGSGQFELFRIEFQAGAAPGTVDFAGDPAGDTNPGDETQHIITPFGGSAAINALQVLYGATSIDVVGPAAAMSAGVPVATNVNPLDVNGDSVVSPLDALLVINRLGNAQLADSSSDVDGDGATTPLDALLVINRLGSGATPRAAMSARASVSDTTASSATLPTDVESSLPASISLSVDEVFADLDDATSSPETSLAAFAQNDLFDRWSVTGQADSAEMEADVAELDDDLFAGI